jgi:hypothetical protein
MIMFLVMQDPMSHRIIEKRRRDRMNNCLADLSRLIPAEYMKKGRGRVEKTEIIEMAIKHMKYLQSNVCSTGKDFYFWNIYDISTLNIEQNKHVYITYTCHIYIVENQPPPCSTEESTEPVEIEKSENSTPGEPDNSILMADQYKMGFLECLTETMQYLVEGHGYPPNHGLCLSLINHLQQHCAQIVKGIFIFYFFHRCTSTYILIINKINDNCTSFLQGNK